MTKISSSPDRHSFAKEKLKYLSNFKEIHDMRFNDPKARENNLEYDLLTTDWILAKVRNSDDYAKSLYAAMCNNDFVRLEVLPILEGETWGCSWRYAGGIIADMRETGDYIDWYCSGNESEVTEEIREDLLKLGWVVKSLDGEF
jgi:hypothetical protein